MGQEPVRQNRLAGRQGKKIGARPSLGPHTTHRPHIAILPSNSNFWKGERLRSYFCRQPAAVGRWTSTERGQSKDADSACVGIPSAVDEQLIRSRTPSTKKFNRSQPLGSKPTSFNYQRSLEPLRRRRKQRWAASWMRIWPTRSVDPRRQPNKKSRRTFVGTSKALSPFTVGRPDLLFETGGNGIAVAIVGRWACRHWTAPWHARRVYGPVFNHVSLDRRIWAAMQHIAEWLKKLGLGNTLRLLLSTRSTSPCSPLSRTKT